MFDESRRFAGLEIGDQPLSFVEALRGSAEPDGVAADYDEMIWCCLLHGGILSLLCRCM